MTAFGGLVIRRFAILVLALASGAASAQDDSSGLIPHVRIGPEISLISFPSPAVGIEAKLWDRVGVSLEYGFIPRVGISDIEAKYRMWQGSVKVYPFRGAFFVGALAGTYELTASETSGGQTVTTTVDSTILGPQVGWRWVYSSGFFLGLDLAWGFALHYESTLTPPSSIGTIGDIKKNADKYLENGVPVLGLLHLGWFF